MKQEDDQEMVDLTSLALNNINFSNKMNDEKEELLIEQEEECQIIFYYDNFIKFSRLLEIGDQHALSLFIAALLVFEMFSYPEASILTLIFNLLLIIGRYLIVEETDKLRFKQLKLLKRDQIIKSLMHIDLFYSFRAILRNIVIIGMVIIGIRLIILMVLVNLTNPNHDSVSSMDGNNRYKFNNLFAINLVNFFTSAFGIFSYLKTRSSVNIPSNIKFYLPDKKRPSELELGYLLLHKKYGVSLEDELEKYNVKIKWFDKTNKQTSSPFK